MKRRSFGCSSSGTAVQLKATRRREGSGGQGRRPAWPEASWTAREGLPGSGLPSVATAVVAMVVVAALAAFVPADLPRASILSARHGRNSRLRLVRSIPLRRFALLTSRGDDGIVVASARHAFLLHLRRPGRDPRLWSTEGENSHGAAND
jgi:hypothetical protein